MDFENKGGSSQVPRSSSLCFSDSQQSVVFDQGSQVVPAEGA
jgi:hypothetical protein